MEIQNIVVEFVHCNFTRKRGAAFLFFHQSRRMGVIFFSFSSCEHIKSVIVDTQFLLSENHSNSVSFIHTFFYTLWGTLSIMHKF
jgi:hypothetical protein